MLRRSGARRPRCNDLRHYRVTRLADRLAFGIAMPDCPFVAPLLYAIPIQLLAYHTAVLKGADVDQQSAIAVIVSLLTGVIADSAPSLGTDEALITVTLLSLGFGKVSTCRLIA